MGDPEPFSFDANAFLSCPGQTEDAALQNILYDFLSSSPSANAIPSSAELQPAPTQASAKRPSLVNIEIKQGDGASVPYWFDDYVGSAWHPRGVVTSGFQPVSLPRTFLLIVMVARPRWLNARTAKRASR